MGRTELTFRLLERLEREAVEAVAVGSSISSAVNLLARRKPDAYRPAAVAVGMAQIAAAWVQSLVTVEMAVQVVASS